MTKMDKLTSMKQADLVALCEKWGVKVHASRGKLKEKRLPVQERLIAAGWPDGKVDDEPEEETAVDDTVDEVQQEVEEEFTDTEQEVKQDDDIPENPMSDEEHELIEALKDFTEIYPDITVEEIGYRSYELCRGNEFIGVVTPCKDNVVVAFTAVEAVEYDKIVDKIAEIIG